MHVQVRDSAVPKREVRVSVARNDDEIIVCLDDSQVEAIGLTVFLSSTEAYKMAIDLLALVTEVSNG
jgi:hypothetical protein